MAGNAGAIRAGRAFVELFADDSKLVRGLKAASTKLKAWGSTVTGMGMKLMAGGAAIVGPLLAATKTFMSAGDALDKMSSRVGASVEFLSALGHAAQIGGTEIEAMETGIRRMQRAAYDAANGSKSTAEAFDTLGVNVKDANGNLKGTEQLFMESATALSRLENNTQKAAIATILFGRAGTQLLPMLKNGKDGLLGFMAEAKELGFIMTDEDVKAAADLTDAWTRLTTGAKMAVIQIGGALAPALQQAADSAREWIHPVIEWVKHNQELVVTVAKIGAGVAVAGAAAVVFGTVISSVGSIVGGAVVVTKALGVALTFLAAHPMVATLAGVTALVVAYGALTRATENAKRAMNEYYTRQSSVRQEDRARFQELEKLAGQQSLSSDEMSRANGIVSTLETRYGALGISIDAATGKIGGMTEAQAKLNAAMRQMQLNQVEMELRDVAAELDRAEAHADEFAQRGLFTSGWTMKTAGAQQEAYHNVERLGDKQRLLRKQMDILKGGGDVEEWGEAGKSAGDAFTGGAADAIEANQALLDQIVRLSIDSIEDPFVREMASITQHYEEAMRRAAEAGQDVTLVEAARALAIDNAIAAEERRQKIEQKGEAERQAAEAERLGGEEEAIRRRIEDLELELFVPDERDREQIQLNREFDRAMAGAQTDEARRLLNIEYQRKQDLLDQKAAETKLPGATKGGFTVGTFSKWALGGLGMGGNAAEQTAKNTFETTKLIRELIRQGHAVKQSVFSE
jgi:TP901 family phage tail tape measure protein